MNKYQKIDRDKLSPKGKTLYDKLKKKSNNFEDTDGKLGEILEAFYNKTQTKKAKTDRERAQKRMKEVKKEFDDKKKAKAKAKAKAKPKKSAKSKPKAKKKTTKKTTKSKSGNTGSFAKLRAAIAKRDGITYKQALPIAKKEYAKQKESITKEKRGKTESRLSAYKRKYKGRTGGVTPNWADKAPSEERDIDKYAEARSKNNELTLSKSWVESLKEKGFTSPVIRELTPDLSKMWFSQNDIEYVANLSPTGITHIEKAVFTDPKKFNRRKMQVNNKDSKSTETDS